MEMDRQSRQAQEKNFWEYESTFGEVSLVDENRGENQDLNNTSM